MAALLTMAKVFIRQFMLLQVIVTFFVFVSFLNSGNAGITSTFIRSEWPATDIPLDNEAFAVPNGHNAPQQVRDLFLVLNPNAVLISFCCYWRKTKSSLLDIEKRE